VVTQKRFYLLLLNDPNGEHAQGPYTKSEARIRQIASTGARIVSATQLNQLRAHAVLENARRLAHDQNDPRIFKGSLAEFFERASKGGNDADAD
jgi:hypothetical protein